MFHAGYPSLIPCRGLEVEKLRNSVLVQCGEEELVPSTKPVVTSDYMINRLALQPLCLIIFSDVLRHLKSFLPPDGYGIIGICWVDLYPDEQWNFVLGESSCTDGCAVMSFGHFEPQSFVKKQQNQIPVNINADDNLQKHFSLLHNRNSIGQKLFVDEFTDAFEFNKELIWRLLRVSCCKPCFLCFFFWQGTRSDNILNQRSNMPVRWVPLKFSWAIYKSSLGTEV